MDNLSCKIELCLVYSLSDDCFGVPLKWFETISNGELALEDLLAPVDTQSVQDAIEDIQVSLSTTVPNIDMNIRFQHPRSEDEAPTDLVAIRYRQKATDDNCTLQPLSNGAAPLRFLECQFGRRFSKELHRHSWLCRQRLSLACSSETAREEQLRQIEEDYAREFPDSNDNKASSWSE